MSTSNTITKTDLANILNEVLPIGEHRTLLWTNPSPDVAFTAQDVTVSGAWDTYDYIEVEYKDNNAYDSDTGGKIIERTPCHATTTASFVNWVSSSSRWEIWHRARWWNSAHTAIHFDSGYWNALSTASGTGQSDNNLVPYKIYGITV